MAGDGARLRAVAAEIVHAVAVNGHSLERSIEHQESRLQHADRALLRLLAYGSLRHHWQLESWQRQLISRPLKRRDAVIAALLRVGLYQLTQTRIPDHAVVAETVEAARLLRKPQLAGLVNACLRRFMRESLQTAEADSEAARHNHPDWFLKRLREDWPEDWREIVNANNARAPMWLRVDQSRATADQFRQRLGERDAVTLAAIPGALRLAEPCGVDELPGFDDGVVSVQDAAAQLAAAWLQPEPSERILDACAAPGGKTVHLLELGADELVAVDKDEERLARVKDNLARAGRSATIVTGDASRPEEWWDGRPFDAVLLDAPCSASGVVRRHPDIRLLRRDRDIAVLADLQHRMLQSLWGVLRPGGRLLYATCSVFAAENEAVTAEFLRQIDDAVEDPVLPNNNIRDLMRRQACGYQILPGTAGMDGFYYACLKKKTS